MKDHKMLSPVQTEAAIDWNAIHRRMSDTQTLADKGWSVTGAAEQKKILKARARTIAQEPPAEVDPGEQIAIIEFLLVYERYAVELSYVREVCPLKELTSLPGARPFVAGIINIRGQIVSIIDLKKFFDLPEKGLTDLNKVIVLHSDKMEFGILTDGILGVWTIPLGALQPSLPTLIGIREEYLKGITKERAVILDAEKLLADTKVIVKDELEM